jgi:hypothetical protein
MQSAPRRLTGMLDLVLYTILDVAHGQAMQ